MVPDSRVVIRETRQDARKTELVQLRYFAGLTIEETAEALGISTGTAKRDWAHARAWLHREIRAMRAEGAGWPAPQYFWPAFR